jgi:hypothetical protein
VDRPGNTPALENQALPGPKAQGSEAEEKMRPAKISAGLAALALVALFGAQPAAAADPIIWLNVEVTQADRDGARIKINVPLSLMEVVVDSLNTSHFMDHFDGERGVDLANLWKHLRDADLDEFVTIEADHKHIRIFKEHGYLRMTVKGDGYDEVNAQVRIPFALMDFLVEGENEEFRLSDLVATLQGHLPLVLVEANSMDESVKVWLEER